MRTAALLVLGLAFGFASAQESNDTEADEIDRVDLRVSVLEVIDVTAEKKTAVQAEESNEDIDAILAEAEALDDGEEPE